MEWEDKDFIDTNDPQFERVDFVKYWKKESSKVLLFRNLKKGVELKLIIG
jgi:endo-alpha-1,4-polygalactosaminidase (GH114 family)